MPSVYKPATERIWNRVAVGPQDRCWPYIGKKLRDGYGRISDGPRGSAKILNAHRVAWEANNGPIPVGLLVCHKCDNRLCCNPAHLFLGTATDNNHDRHKKGRSRGAPGKRNAAFTHPHRVRRGSLNGRAKLTEQSAASIRTEYATGLYTQRQIAKKWNVTQALVQKVVTNQMWRHVK